MTNKKDNSRYQFNTNDINESRYIIEMIYRDIFNTRKSYRNIYEMSNDEISAKINRLIPEKVGIIQIKAYSERYKEEMKRFREKNLSWVEGNFHSALYLWFSLFICRRKRYSDRELNSITFRGKKATPETIKNIINDILEFSSSEFSQLKRIEDEINGIHEEYQNLTGHKRLTWLKDDEEQISWAYQYLKEKDRYFSRNYAVDHIHALTCIKVYYDLNINNKEVLYTFLEMSNAWNQKRYREKRKNDNKKALSGYISNEAKNRLKEISKKEKMSESEMIELLIMTY